MNDYKIYKVGDYITGQTPIPFGGKVIMVVDANIKLPNNTMVRKIEYTIETPGGLCIKKEEIINEELNSS